MCTQARSSRENDLAVLETYRIYDIDLVPPFESPDALGRCIQARSSQENDLAVLATSRIYYTDLVLPFESPDALGRCIQQSLVSANYENPVFKLRHFRNSIRVTAERTREGATGSVHANTTSFPERVI